MSFLFSSRLCLATQFGLSGIVVARLTANLLEGLGFLSPLSSQTDYWLDVSALAAIGALLFTLPRCVFGGTGFRKSVARQGQILEQLHEAVIATDGEGIIVSWNSGAERLFGYTADEAIGQHVSMLQACTKNEMEREIIAPLLKAGRLDMEGPMVRKSGDQFVGHMLASVLLGPDGGVAGMVGYILDITERKRAEQELRRNERLLAEAQRIAHLGNWDYDVAQNTIWWSDETYRLLGLEPDTVTPSLKSYLDLLPVEEQKNFKAALQDPIDHKRAYSLEHTVVLHDGAERVVHLRAEPVCDENGEVVRVTGTLMDVTERRAAQNALQDAHDQLEQRVAARTRELGTTLETIAEGVITIDDRGTIEQFNRSAEKLFGYSADEILGRNVNILVTGNDRHQHDGYVARYLDTGTPRVIGSNRRTEAVRKDGTTFPIHLSIAEMEIGGARKFVGTVADISDQVRAQAALIESEAQLSILTNLSPVGMIRADTEGQVVFANETYCRFVGRDAHEVLGDGYVRSIHPDDRPGVLEAWSSSVAEGVVCEREFRLQRPNGTSVRVYAQTSPVRDDKGQILYHIATFTDITEREQTRAALEQSEQRFDLAMRGANDGLWDLNYEDSSAYYSPQWKKILGYEDHELSNEVNVWHPLVHPEDRPIVSKFIKDCLMEPMRNFEMEYRMRHKDGHYVDVLGRGFAVLDELGRPSRMVGVNSDITARKAAERDLQTAKDEAEAANNVKTEFLSRMSHELRTPMNAVLGFAQIFEADCTDSLSEQQQEYVGAILESGFHMMDLINDILDLSKIETRTLKLEMHNQPLESIVESALDLIRAPAEQKGISVTFPRHGGELPQVNVDTQRFQQVLLNLLSNAIKFNRPDGSILVECETGSEGAVRINVTDTGKGIPEDAQGLVFDAFTRLGAEFSQIPGTGLGLTVAKELIEKMGGAIGFDSVPGTGTTFWIDLPIAEPTVAEEPAEAEPEPAAANEPAKTQAPHLEVVTSN